MAPLSDLSDEALQSVAKRSLSYGDRARELLKARVNGVVADTRELTGLTADLMAENEETHRQQLGAPSEQDRALACLKELFPS